jgi:methylated-DNA-protein-cysteine methyltransferase-like protein
MVSRVFQRVYEIVAKVPPGRVVTYGQIARCMGMPNGARTVGWAMRQCPSVLPWHRVVSAQGRISARGRPVAASLQRALLAEEGVVFDACGRVDLEAAGWDGI